MVLTSYSQTVNSTKEIQIDPRQYVRVMYSKTYNQSKWDTIWNWENQKNIPNQKFQILDVNGEIRIEFDRMGLTKNLFFEGGISLEAEISGPSGTRKVEVNPYSEIGLQRKPIGIKSDPPLEISKKLLNILKESATAYYYYKNCYWDRGFPESASCRESFHRVLEEIETELSSKNANKKLDYLNEKLVKSISDYNSAVINNTIYTLNFPSVNINNVVQFKNVVSSVEDSLDKSEALLRRGFEAHFWDALKYENQRVGLIINYLDSFESAGEDATNTFLSLINKDPVQYKSMKNLLLSEENNLKRITVPTYEVNNETMDSILVKNYQLIYDCSHDLYELLNFKGSTLANIVNHFAIKNNVSFKDFTNYEDDAVGNELDFWNKTLDTAFLDISDSLSLIAGRIIYKKLIYATIDLGKSGAKSGDVLDLYLTWILDTKKDSSANSPRLPIGKYYLRETGWKLEVADMFSLVKRINEPINDPTVSPSNFKGAGGAVLLWTYNKEDKGISTIKDSSGIVVKVRRKNWIANSLEPSIGLNVSYLDFSTKKDVEIGTGLQIGLFHNKLFFGYGVNLHMWSPKQSPYYYFLGFSFAKLSDFFTGSKSVTAVQ